MIRPFRAACAPRSLRIEPLEDRRLLAATDLELLLDVRAGVQPSSPTWLTPVGNTLYFVADNNGSNIELWKTDGSSAGTTLVEEIRTSPTAGSTPLQLTSFNGALYFQADNANGGRELWKSDGTAAGTFKLLDINPTGSGFAGPVLSTEPFAVMGSAFYFRANDGVTGPQIWRSDGTAAGTTRVSNINAPTGCDPSDLTVVGNTLFFRATDGTGYEVWKTDGTPGGTSRVKNINTTATGNANPLSLTAVGNTLFFSADDGTSGAELWKSDGTEGGTVRVKDIRSNGSSFPSQLTPVGQTLYFSAIQSGTDRELWKTDGADAGTVRVRDINPGAGASAPTFLTNLNGTLYFAASNGSINELYKSNGTDAGTIPVTSTHVPTSPTNLKVVGGTLYFSATTAAAGVELWKTDGSGAGTVIVEDLNPGTPNGSPAQIVDFGGRVYLVATTTRTGTEIWREAPKSYGNYDQDSDVDGADFLRWQRRVGTSEFGTDANRDGVVNAADLGPWRSGFGTQGPPPIAPEGVANGSGDGSENTGGGLPALADNVFLASDLFAQADDETEPALAAAIPDDAVAARDVAYAAASAPPELSGSAAASRSGDEPDSSAGFADSLPLELVDAAFADLM
jgi:ELWxxDGT repeat protein